MKRLTRDAILDSAYLSRNLAGKSVRSGMTTVAAQGIHFVLHLMGTMVLARLLTSTNEPLTWRRTRDDKNLYRIATAVLRRIRPSRASCAGAVR